MTKQELFTQVRQLGLAVTALDGEYRVTYGAWQVRDAARREALAYYTDDRQDALDTARRMPCAPN